MYRAWLGLKALAWAWLGLKALAWAWLWWAWALEILSQARIQGLPKPEAWLGLKPGLIYHI